MFHMYLSPVHLSGNFLGACRFLAWGSGPGANLWYKRGVQYPYPTSPFAQRPFATGPFDPHLRVLARTFRRRPGDQAPEAREGAPCRYDEGVSPRYCEKGEGSRDCEEREGTRHFEKGQGEGEV